MSDVSAKAGSEALKDTLAYQNANYCFTAFSAVIGIEKKCRRKQKQQRGERYIYMLLSSSSWLTQFKLNFEYSVSTDRILRARTIINLHWPFDSTWP